MRDVRGVVRFRAMPKLGLPLGLAPAAGVDPKLILRPFFAVVGAALDTDSLAKGSFKTSEMFLVPGRQILWLKTPVVRIDFVA